MEIPDKEILVIDRSMKGLIGKGSYGEVRRGNLVGTPVAVKILRRDKIFKASDLDGIIREAQLMKEIRHPNVVRYIDAFDVSLGDVKIVTELCDSDMDHLSAMRSSPDFVTKAVKWFCEAARGLAYMHDVKGMVHRDIKPANILLKNDVALLTDFGFTVTWDEMDAEPKGTPIYAAPELWDGNNDSPVDVYSFGMTMFAVLAGIDPGHRYTSMWQIKEDVVNNHARPGFDEIKIQYPPNLGALIKNCWRQDPKNRPDMKTVYERLKLIYLETILPSPTSFTMKSATVYTLEFDFWLSHFGDELSDSIPMNKFLRALKPDDTAAQMNIMNILQLSMSDKISLKTIYDTFNWYGSFGTRDKPYEPRTDAEILERICSDKESKTWFVGYLERHEAATRILAQWESAIPEYHHVPCFLVRCSKTNSFTAPFTITYIDGEGIHEERVYREKVNFVPYKISYHGDDVHYVVLHEESNLVCRDLDPKIKEKDIFTLIEKLASEGVIPSKPYDIGLKLGPY